MTNILLVTSSPRGDASQSTRVANELAEKLHARDVVLLAGRLLLSLIFVHEGLELATHFEGSQKAMAALGVPTTRSLAAVTTGNPVYRETRLPGAVVTRVASSHSRVGVPRKR